MLVHIFLPFTPIPNNLALYGFMLQSVQWSNTVLKFCMPFMLHYSRFSQPSLHSLPRNAQTLISASQHSTHLLRLTSRYFLSGTFTTLPCFLFHAPIWWYYTSLTAVFTMHLSNISNSPPRLTVVLCFSTSLQLNGLALASEMGVGVIINSQCLMLHSLNGMVPGIAICLMNVWLDDLIPEHLLN